MTATLHLNAINQFRQSMPWKLTFSFGRALQDESLKAWQGKPANIAPGQRAFFHRARCVSAAALGNYTDTMEQELAA